MSPTICHLCGKLECEHMRPWEKPVSGKHTPEPWRVGDAGHTVFGPPDGSPAPVVVAANLKRSNAARIMACVNACQGINPEAVPLMLEALEAALDAICQGDENTRTEAEDAAKPILRAALAKASGA